MAFQKERLDAATMEGCQVTDHSAVLQPSETRDEAGMDKLKLLSLESRTRFL